MVFSLHTLNILRSRVCTELTRLAKVGKAQEQL